MELSVHSYDSALFRATHDQHHLPSLGHTMKTRTIQSHHRTGPASVKKRAMVVPLGRIVSSQFWSFFWSVLVSCILYEILSWSWPCLVCYVCGSLANSLICIITSLTYAQSITRSYRPISSHSLQLAKPQTTSFAPRRFQQTAALQQPSSER